MILCTIRRDADPLPYGRTNHMENHVSLNIPPALTLPHHHRRSRTPRRQIENPLKQRKSPSNPSNSLRFVQSVNFNPCGFEFNRLCHHQTLVCCSRCESRGVRSRIKDEPHSSHYSCKSRSRYLPT